MTALQVVGIGSNPIWCLNYRRLPEWSIGLDSKSSSESSSCVQIAQRLDFYVNIKLLCRSSSEAERRIANSEVVISKFIYGSKNSYECCSIMAYLVSTIYEI